MYHFLKFSRSGIQAGLGWAVLLLHITMAEVTLSAAFDWWLSKSGRYKKASLTWLVLSILICCLIYQFSDLSFFTSWRLPPCKEKAEDASSKLGLELTQCHTCHILLVKVNHKASSDSGGE